MNIADESVSPRRPEQSHWRRWLLRAVFESALIALSVLLALAASAWVDGRRTAARVQEMRGFLRAEIQANRDMVAHPNTLGHHERLKKVFVKALDSSEGLAQHQAAISAAEALFKSGLHPAPVSNAVWTSVSSRDLIENMEPREVFALAALYRAQANLEMINRAGYDVAVSLVELIATGEGARGRIMRTSMMLEDMTAEERRLLILYDKALADLADAPPVRSSGGTRHSF